MDNENEFSLELRHVTKRFPGVIANKDINLTLKKGEILALLGENGSGKTTLMNMISGIYYPDEGQIYVNGEEVFIRSPQDAFRYKIGMIHQHFKLVDVFTAAQNIVLGINDGKKFSLRDVNARVKEIADKYGFVIDPKKKIYDMSVSEKQTVEIVKVLYRGADILILDEPTAVLTPQETEKLFDVMRSMKADGKSIIIITHKLHEVLSISDRVSILRKGEYIGSVNTAETTGAAITEMMVGKKVELNIERPVAEKNDPLLEVRDLVVRGDEGSIAVDKLNFFIRGGEILGVVGIAGSGQKELCEAIAGLRKIEGGGIYHEGESIVGLSPDKIAQRGVSMSFIPEDRLGMGLAPSMGISANMILKNYRLAKGPFVDIKKGRSDAEKIIRELDIVTPSTETAVRKLSGGNVQKVLLGREIMTDPNVLITAYPVRGLDVNSSYLIYDILNRAKMRGAGVLFIGEDLDVILALCDKIMVICHGALMGVVHAQRTTKEELGLMMTGALNKMEEKHKVMGIAKDSQIEEGGENNE